MSKGEVIDTKLIKYRGNQPVLSAEYLRKRLKKQLETALEKKFSMECLFAPDAEKGVSAIAIELKKLIIIWD